MRALTDNRVHPEPLKYQQLSAAIRTWIETGMFQPGEPVPSITDLAADRGLARETCARALQSLAAEGLLTRYPGFGYYVSGPAHEHQLRMTTAG